MNKLDLVKMAIESVYTEWSESRHIIEDRTNTIDGFMAECKKASRFAPPKGQGYDKTKFIVTFVDGTKQTHRVDLTQDHFCPLEVVAYYID